jgi:lipoyl(octanoyl) transferase
MLAAWLGTVAYEEALALQRRLVSARSADDIGDVLLLLEHDRVYTAGRHADLGAHVLGTTGIRVVPTDRGGDVTYHGPGQLVAYPITRLPHPKAARSYVEALQQACVAVAAGYGLQARPDPDRTGVWVGGEKLVAIGVRIDRGVTSHGLAFNVTTDLGDFAGIVPCGIPDAGVCSLASLGVSASVREVADRLAAQLGRTLDRPLRWGTLDEVDPAPATRAAAG